MRYERAGLTLDDIYKEPGFSVKPEEEQVWAESITVAQEMTIRAAIDEWDYSVLASHIAAFHCGDMKSSDTLMEKAIFGKNENARWVVVSAIHNGIEFRCKKATERIFWRKL